MNISPTLHTSTGNNDSHQLLVPDTLGQILSFLPVYQRATCKAVCTTFNEVVNQDQEYTNFPSDIKKSAERIYKSIEKNIHGLEEDYYRKSIQPDYEYRIDKSISRVLSILTNKQENTKREVRTLTETLEGATSQHRTQVKNAFLLNIKLADDQSTRSQVIQSIHHIAFSIIRVAKDIFCGMYTALIAPLVLVCGMKMGPVEIFRSLRDVCDLPIYHLLKTLRVYFVGKKTLTFIVELRKPSHTQHTNVDGEQQRDLPLAIFTNRDNKIFIDSTLRYLNNTLLSNLEEMEKADRNLQDIKHPDRHGEFTERNNFLRCLELFQTRDANNLIKANLLVDQYKKAITTLQELDGGIQIDENIHQAGNKLENCRKDILKRNSLIIEELECAEKTLSELESLILQTV